MAQVTVTNLTNAPVYLSDFYATLDPAGGANASRVFTRSPSQLTVAVGLQALIAAGSVTVSVVLTAAELASGLAQAPDTVDATDVQEVLAATPLSMVALVRMPMVAGVAGTPDDVQVLAVNTLPYKFRVVNAWAMISTAVGASTLQLRTRAGGLGTALGEVGSATTGYQPMDATNTASGVATPGALEGLFVRRSDRGVAGEIFALIRRET